MKVMEIWVYFMLWLGYFCLREYFSLSGRSKSRIGKFLGFFGEL